MNKPILVVMAAGLGSRYGSLKQMDPIGNNGEWLIDFSLYDAAKAGFSKAVFIVREENIKDFKNTIGERIKGAFQVDYIVQSLEDLPNAHTVPAGRLKPWGTGHAIYSARKAIGDAAFMAINADDYYGPEAFRGVYNYLKDSPKGGEPSAFTMIGYPLKNTVTQYGHVSRGVCKVGRTDLLERITERTHIVSGPQGLQYSEDEGLSWEPLEENTLVSLNCWGFQPALFREMEESFSNFLREETGGDPLTKEYYLPTAVEELVQSGRCQVKVLPTKDKWYGVTYPEDKAPVAKALVELKEKGQYPFDLWQEFKSLV